MWRWSEWPGRHSGDIGVDIVAQRPDGGLTAIQCKCYDPNSTLYEQNLATFLAYTNADFDERLIISTTPNWSRNLLALISNQQPPVQRLDLFGLEATTIDWDAYLEDDAAPLAERPRKEVRPHQQRALDGVFAGFARAARDSAGPTTLKQRKFRSPRRRPQLALAVIHASLLGLVSASEHHQHSLELRSRCGSCCASHPMAAELDRIDSRY